jgi:hypothetical protein
MAGCLGATPMSRPSVTAAQRREEAEDQVEMWIWSVNCRLISLLLKGSMQNADCCLIVKILIIGGIVYLKKDPRIHLAYTELVYIISYHPYIRYYISLIILSPVDIIILIA